MAWRTSDDDAWQVDSRRHRTNRRNHKASKYEEGAFDFLIVWVPNTDVFYVFPSSVVQKYAGRISMREPVPAVYGPKNTTKDYRNRWDLLALTSTGEIEQSTSCGVEQPGSLQAS